MQLVVGIDEHSDTEALLECALDLAHRIEGQVLLLNVVEPDEATEVSTGARGTTTEEERFRRLASDYVWGSMSIAVEPRQTDEGVAACIRRVCRLRRADISTHVGQVGADSFWLTGNLTIHGVTREVTLRGRFAEPLTNLAGLTEVQFSLVAEIDREGFGITWNAPFDGDGVVVGKIVTIAIRATLTRVAVVNAVSGSSTD